MAEILCVRHGQASFGSDNYDQLSDKGYQQGRLLGDYLLAANVNLDKIYVGTLKRQVQTAEAVRQRFAEHGKPLPECIVDSRWDELQTEEQIKLLAPLLVESNSLLEHLMLAAQTDSRSFQKLVEIVFEHWVSLTRNVPGLESWAEADQRVKSVLSEVMAQSDKGSRVAVFTSAGVIAMVSAHAMKSPLSGVYPLFEKVINCSITRLLHNGERIALSSFNEFGFLQAMAAQANEPDIITYR